MIKLKARFIKSAKPDGSQDFEESFWDVWHGDELVMKLTVAELHYLNLSYQDIATKEFGKLLLSRIRKHLDNAIDNAAPSWDLTQ